MKLTFIQKLTEDILQDDYFNSLLEKVIIISTSYLFSSHSESFSDKEFIDILRFADLLSNSTDSNARNKAYQIITNLNPFYNGDSRYKTVAKAVYSKLGNYPAITYLEKQSDDIEKLPISRIIEDEAKKIIQEVPDGGGLIFTDSQYELYSKMINSLEFSFSGPTSMGKSFLIKNFIRKAIKNTPKENIAIIVPTRALINQFVIEIKAELNEQLEHYKYKVVTNSNIADLITDELFNYILVLTPERLVSYLSQETNPILGFLFVDEAHKLAQGKDSRSVTTYVGVERALKQYGKSLKLYFASPNVSNPEVFLTLFNRNTGSNFFHTNESPVSQNLYFIDLLDRTIETQQNQIAIPISTNGFFQEINDVSDLIYRLGNEKNNLIYCNTKTRTIDYAWDFSKKLKFDTTNKTLSNAVKTICEYIHPDYYLAGLLKKGIAYHHGKLPQLIRNLVEELYKDGDVKNVFCTSTLLEGVNMPTQNLFVLDDRNGLSRLRDIDFWNLTGRAGRLTKELSGNIFCIRHDDCDWSRREILKRKEIKLNPTVTDKLEVRKYITRIEELLKGNQIKTSSKEELLILEYIANIICVDTFELKTKYKSPLIEKLIENNKEKIIELAKKKVENYVIPPLILGSNQSIDLNNQDNLYKSLKERVANGKSIALPRNNFKYETILRVLNTMHVIYKWDSAEKKLNNKNSLKYYAVLMNQWINGFSLSQIIKNTLDYYEVKNMSVEITYNQYIPFVPGNKKHINIVIEKLIDDIEYILRFLLEKYFNHYHVMVSNLIGEEAAGENWATLLEYGTQNRIVIAMQNVGLSRHTAIKIYKDYKSVLSIIDNKLVSIDKTMLLNKLRKDSLEYDEISKML